jgi:hypothetical protein
MHGKTRTGAAKKPAEANVAGAGNKVEAFVIGQVAGRPLYLVVGADAAHHITPGLPFNDD